MELSVHASIHDEACSSEGSSVVGHSGLARQEVMPQEVGEPDLSSGRVGPVGDQRVARIRLGGREQS